MSPLPGYVWEPALAEMREVAAEKTRWRAEDVIWDYVEPVVLPDTVQLPDSPVQPPMQPAVQQPAQPAVQQPVQPPVQPPLMYISGYMHTPVHNPAWSGGPVRGGVVKPFKFIRWCDVTPK